MSYFTVEDVQQSLYVQLPKALLYEENYKKMSNDSKVLYSFLMDKVLLSLKNNWIDENKNIFIRCSEIAMAEILNKSEKTVRKFKNELIDKGLLEQPDSSDKTRLYIKKPSVTVEKLGEYLEVFNAVVKDKRKSETERIKDYRLRKAQGKVLKLKESLCNGKNYRSIENTSVEGVKEKIEENVTVKTTGMKRSKLPYSNNDFSNNDFCMYVCTDESEKEIETPFIELATRCGIIYTSEIKEMIMSYEEVFSYELYEYLFMDILNKYRNGKVTDFGKYLLSALDTQSSKKNFTLGDYLEYKREFSDINYPRKQYKAPKRTSKPKDNQSIGNDTTDVLESELEPKNDMSVSSFDAEKSNKEFDEKIERIRFRQIYGLIGNLETAQMDLEQLKEYVRINNLGSVRHLCD